MVDFLTLVAALLAGAGLGAFFFGGLWWTVRRGLGARRAALWFLSSLLVRTAVVTLGFYFILGDDWRRLVVGLIGFTLARVVVTRLTRPPGGSMQNAPEASHAP